jgi:hypothetical protein
MDIKDSWYSNPGDNKKRVLSSGLWIHHKYQSKDAKSIYRHVPDELVSTNFMQGHNIGVLEDGGRSTLQWLKPDGSSTPLKLAPALAIPQREQGIREIYFTKYGLDVVDASGTLFRPVSRAGNIVTATIPETTILSTKAGQALMDFWKAVLKHLSIQLADISLYDLEDEVKN